MVLWLIHHGMLNGPDVRSSSYLNAYTSNVHELAASMERQDRNEVASLIESILQGQEVSLEMGHPGRLRLSEL